ncbi:MAG: hypothetical protein H7Z75_02315 [Ferruginibacter sp.]|nr:hypothetical protein [Cytophagales bacterium]
MKARFRIGDSFVITGRGLALLGEILEGTLRRGDELTFHLNDKTYHLVITGIDMGVRRVGEKGNPFVGLLVRADEQETVELDRNVLLRGTIAGVASA